MLIMFISDFFMQASPDNPLQIFQHFIKICNLYSAGCVINCTKYAYHCNYFNVKDNLYGRTYFYIYS